MFVTIANYLQRNGIFAASVEHLKKLTQLHSVVFVDLVLISFVHMLWLVLNNNRRLAIAPASRKSILPTIIADYCHSIREKNVRCELQDNFRQLDQNIRNNCVEQVQIEHSVIFILHEYEFYTIRSFLKLIVRNLCT